MLTAIARLVTARPKTVLVGALVIIALCGGLGASVQSHLKIGGFVTPAMESSRADQFIRDHFPGGNPNLVVLVHSPDGVDSAAAQATGQRIVRDLHRPSIAAVQSYWTTDRTDLAQGLRSRDGTSGLVLADLLGDDNDEQRTIGDLSTQLALDAAPGITVRLGGAAAVQHDLTKQIATDLLIAEGVAVPLTFLVLVLVFGSVVAAALPAAIGVFSIATTVGILRAFTTFTDVSIFALNMTTALGLALAIDYSLFIVSRYREELANGAEDAVERTLHTAGRTVLFSAVPVALCMAAMAVFPQYFLHSFAEAGVAVVVAASAAAVIALPAALVLLGPRINAGDLRKPVLRVLGRTPAAATPPEDSRWYRYVIWVMKHAVPIALVSTAVLLLVGSPFLSARLGYPDDRTLPTTASSHQVGDALRTEFGADVSAGLVAVMPGYHGDSAAIGSYAARLSAVDHVPAVLSSDGIYLAGTRVAAAPPGLLGKDGAYISIQTDLDPYSAAGGAQLHALRGVVPPSPVLFGGTAAVSADALHDIFAYLPLVAAVIVVATFIVLFLFTGSILIPLKALLLNALSLSASFGAMVWIFQRGHLSRLLGFTPTGYLDAAMPILMFCLAFGMSMDYEVFLLSRIREEWLAAPQPARTVEHNTHAVAMGVARTGRIFTAAALLMAIVFIALATSRVSILELFGVGLSLAVITDATIIRALLVPALMRLLNTANWWLPGPLAALHRRLGLAD